MAGGLTWNAVFIWLLRPERTLLEKFLWGPIMEDPTKFSLSVCSGLRIRSKRKSSFQATPRSMLPHPALFCEKTYAMIHTI